MKRVQDTEHFDILIKNGTIIDGSGKNAFVGSIGISDDKIVQIFNTEIDDLDSLGFSADLIIDAKDLIVCPGFIDTHAHEDLALLYEGGHMLPKVSQGVTTVIVGNCGLSASPLSIPSTVDIVNPLPLIGFDREMWKYPDTSCFVKALEENPPTINCSFLIGHTTLRLDAIKNSKEINERPANGDEMEHMKRRLTESLASGAVGLSTGLAYPSAISAPTSEVISLAKVTADYGRLYATHIRNEGETLYESVEEALTIGKTANIPVVISHFKAAGKPHWDKLPKTLDRIKEASKTQQVVVDVYPYNASSTLLYDSHIVSSDKVLISWSDQMSGCAGKDLAELAAEASVTPLEFAKRLYPAGGIFFMMKEENVQTILQYENAMIGSDGLFFDKFPHPRLYGTFPRVLGHYARDCQLFTLPEAIRKMTSLPAKTFNLPSRGTLKKGFFADIAIFHYQSVEDSATYSSPKTLANGIKFVIVNGKIVYKENNVTKERPGRVVKPQ